MGLGNLEENNWGPRNCAVEKTLLSWRQRNLSFRGKALVINGFLVSKETVVLRRWGDQNKSLVLSNELINVELPP